MKAGTVYLFFLFLVGCWFGYFGLTNKAWAQEDVFYQRRLSDSGARREKIVLKKKIKDVYLPGEVVKIEVSNPDLNEVVAVVTDGHDRLIEVQIKQSDGWSDSELSVEMPLQATPGKYNLVLTDSVGGVVEQDFLWGVLAINPNKPNYYPNETADFAIAVLDEQGKMVCNAELELLVTNTATGFEKKLSTVNGEVSVNPECKSHAYSLKPDYETRVKLAGEGDYQLKLTAWTKNGVFSVSDMVRVRDEMVFELERFGATRLYPVNTYPMRIKLTVNKDFEGNLYEEVPDSFVVNSLSGVTGFNEIITDGKGKKRLVWKVNVKKGQTVNLGYEYRVPMISPQFYLMGNMTATTLTDLVFGEERWWQQAADDLPAAGFYFSTGYYLGNGNFNRITGLGFRPQLVILKSDSNSIATIFKNYVMPNNDVAYLGSATANNTAGFITLEEDGFTVASTAATAGIRFTWQAFAGSDCTSSGVFCTGGYFGNATYPRTINTGFTPDLVWVKRSTAVNAAWRSSVMPSSWNDFFAPGAGVGRTDFIAAASGGFGVGVSGNVNAGLYYYAAFKEVSGAIDVGMTAGTGGALTISEPGFAPDWVFVKNANIATTGAVANSIYSFGNNSSYFSNTANVVNMITGLGSSGFSLGTNAAVSGVGQTIYWVAFKGETTPLSSSGTFKMSTGSYLGTGDPLAINNLTFSPNLVIVKGNGSAPGVFRTDQMAGDSSAYLDAAVANSTQAITDLTDVGFNIGTSASVNSVGVSYYWTAFGNAWKPGTRSGASDFMVGAYYGNGNDSRDIIKQPYQPDLLTIKRSGASAGTFRTANHSSDLSAFFAASAETSNVIQSIGETGFQVGTAANVNTAANLYWFFGFKTGVGFTLGTYTGTGSSNNINTGLQPDYIWVKGVGGTRGVARFADMSGNGALPFINVGVTTNVITGTGTTGFTLGTAGESNKSGLNYRYAAWQRTVESAGTSEPALHQLLRHGMSFFDGVRQKFRF